MMFIWLQLILMLTVVRGDMYLQSIRGSNNRLDEANRERNNANRLFDSQNNDRGGYNVGKLNVYVGEEIPISWTLQHGCGTDEVKHCDVILQAMCDPLARDGTTTQRIPKNPANCRNFNCDTDVKFGRHESYDWYKKCEQTERNKGLFQASQQPNRGDATRTRQNPGGTRRGYECPEERDYYPYWRPTPFIDLAIFTKDTAKCESLKKESQNVKSRWECIVPQEVRDANKFGNGIGKIPISKEKCEALKSGVAGVQGVNNTVLSAVWTEVKPNGWPAPECLKAEASRPNHLGLTGGDTDWTLKWTVPEQFIQQQQKNSCFLRIRYNITMDYDASAPTGVNLDQNPGGIQANIANPGNAVFASLEPSVDAKFSRDTKKGGNANNRPAKLPLWRKFNLGDAENGYDAATNKMENANNNNLGKKRDYVLRNNPKPAVAGINWPIAANGARTDSNWQLRLQLAVNTAQYGRTFQDRTHMMNFLPKPDIGEARLKMLTVQGKRGNIVQTFPGTEYKMIPNTLHLRKNDFVHFGWSGSDTNPNNNDGQGKKGTDRSNIAPLKNSNYKADTALGTQEGTWFTADYGSQGNNYPAFVTAPKEYAPAKAMSPCSTAEHVADVPMGGLSKETLEMLATGRQKPLSDYGNMEELDDEGTSFQMDPVRVTTTGCWSYVSTRNNNFSNRSQKGRFCVDDGDYDEEIVGPTGKDVVAPSGWISIDPEALDSIQKFTYETEDDSAATSEVVKISPQRMDDILVDPENKPIHLALSYNQRSLSTARLVHKQNPEDAWTEHPAEFKVNDDGRTMAMADITEGGWYKVEDNPNIGAIIAIVFAGLVLMVVVGFLTWHRFFKEKDPQGSVQYTV